MKEEGLLIHGIVLESYQNATFKVKLENNNQSTALCSISGKIRKFNIRITIGDTVIVELSPYDLTKGRIVKRK